RSRHEQSFLDRRFWCLVEFVRDQRPGIARPTGAGAEHCIGDEASPAQELAHTGRILAAAPRQRAVLVDQRGIVPARFGMTKEDDSAHLPIRPSMRANSGILPAWTLSSQRLPQLHVTAQPWRWHQLYLAAVGARVRSHTSGMSPRSIRARSRDSARS